MRSLRRQSTTPSSPCCTCWKEPQVCRMGVMVIVALALLCTCVEAQQVITVSAADLAAASTATANTKHIMHAVTAAGASYKDPAIAFSGIPPTVLLPPGGNNRLDRK